MLEYIWGFKTVAMFDVWSFEHVLSGISIGHAVKNHTRKHLSKIHPEADHSHKSVNTFNLIGVFSIAFAWETLEHYLELGIAGNRVEYWFQGVEAFSNRMLADPLLMVGGYYIALKSPKLVIPVRIASATWLFFHIFIFPHSMYLQKFFV